MLRRRGELGEGRAGCIVSLIIFLAAIFVAWKMIPVKVKAAELRGVIIDEAKSAGTHRDTTIRRVIMTKATELELPLNEKDLVINRTATKIRIRAKYTVPVEFPGYVYHWNFDHEYENPIF
jgi:hypothetical protein